MKLHRSRALIPAPKDAQGLYLVVTPTGLGLDKLGNWRDNISTVNVEVWLRKGDADPTQKDMGDYSVSVYKNGSTTESIIKKNTSSFSFQASKTDRAIEIVLKTKGAKVDAKTVLVTVDGLTGGNTATLFLYKRSATPITKIDWTATLTYTFASQSLNSVPSGWSLNEIPSGTNPIYVTAATAYSTESTDTIAASEWSEPVLYMEKGLNSAPVFLFKRAASTPDKPSATLTYTFATGVLSGSLNGWTQDMPASDGNPCWSIQATAVGTGATDTIPASEWSEQKKLVENGKDGKDGKDGNNGKDGKDGKDGGTGPQGTGISKTTYYYLATTMATGVTRSTSGWTSSYQQGTPDLPYVWRYGDTLLTNGDHEYTDCELIFSYSAGANPNLLEQTNFSSLQALDKWTTRNSCVPVDGVSITQEAYASITTGTQAHNAYYDRTIKPSSQILYKEVLQQCLWNTDGTIRKLEASTWYTLSFWAKGDYYLSTFIYPSVFDNASICYIDGVMQAANTRGSDAYINWSLTSAWKRHTFTFKTKSSISGSNQFLLFRLYPRSSSYYSNSVSICMPKLEVGMQATSYISNEDSTHTGQLRRRRWALNTEYFQGAVDERYEDVVLVGETGFYRCIKTHISTDSNRPGTGADYAKYWTAAKSGQYEMLSTDLFFAEKALINNLIATLIQTGYSGSPHIEAEGSEFKIFGKGQYPAIYLAVNDSNQAVLRFQNENTGEFLYDLGPDGIMKEFSEKADSYTEIKLKKLTNVTRISEILNITDKACTTYYRFNEGYKQIGSGTAATKQYHVSGTATPSAKNSQVFTSQSYNGTTIANGWYVKPNSGNYMAQLTNQYEQNEDGLWMDVPVYVVYIYQYSGGKLVASVPVYFTKTDSQYATSSVGCDKEGNELSTSTYQYLYSYWLANNMTL